MNTYSRALRHIDMNDVKKKHQQRLIEQKIKYNKRVKEKKYIEENTKDKKYNWRKEVTAIISNKIEEEIFDADVKCKEYDWRDEVLFDKKHYFESIMNTSSSFFTTLPALGDTDLSSYDITDPSSYTDLDQYGVTSKSAGSGTGINGGFGIGDHIAFTGTDLNLRSVEFKSFDTTNTDTIKLTAIVGNDNNGGITPASSLEILWYNNITGEYGYENIVSPEGSSSLQNYLYTLPPEAIGTNVSFYLLDSPNNGEMYIGKTLPVPGIDDFPLTAEFANLLQVHVSLNDVPDGPDPTGQTATYHSIGFYYWVNIQYQKYPGYYNFVGAPNGDPAPVSGATKYANLTNADLIYVGKQVYNYFKNSSTYGVTNFSVQRRTPKNIFVPMNSPEATSFIRSEPNLSNLSSQERLQKLKEMLKSSDEYVEKMLGSNFPGTGAVLPGESSNTPGVQVTNISSTKGIFTSPKSDAFIKAFNQGRSVQVDNLGRPISQSTNKPTSTSSTKGIFTSPKSDAFIKAFNQGRSVQVDNLGRPIAGTNPSTSTSVSASKSIEQRSIESAINYLKKEIELRTKLQTTGDAQKAYSSPGMQRALDKLKADLASREKELADKYGSSQNNQQSSTPQPSQPSQPKLDNLGRQIGTPLPPGVQQDMEKGGKTASPVGDAAIIAAASAIAKSGFGGKPAVAPPTASSKVAAALKDLKKSADVTKASKVRGFGNPPTSRNIKTSLRLDYQSYEPEGQLISERRKLKSPQEVLNKIPGYYDGKPAPLGFPETPPPEMVNGMHPDLVDGKKVSDRFNRLDPESAKAMPLTGNPHIDKKVKAARKKPK